METKPIVHVPDDVHLTYDGMHEFIKHEHHITTPPASQLTPIPEEPTCECNAFNPECTACKAHAANYSLYLEHINHNTRTQLKEMTNAYNTLRSNLPNKLMEYYNDGFTHGYYTATASLAVLTTASFFILKYFGR